MSTTTTGTSPSWKNGTWHDVTGPAGTKYELRIPALTELIRNEAVPERLRAIALKSAAHPAGIRGVVADQLDEANEAKTSDEDLVKDDSGLKQAIDDLVGIQKALITESVKCDGKLLSLADVEDPDFPALDAEWLGGVMLREIEYDALGVRLGIAPLNAWARFRHFHDCGPDCGGCASLQDELSTVDLGTGEV
jgi:hypothetical protein